jgi:hypothetical protein
MTDEMIPCDRPSCFVNMTTMISGKIGWKFFVTILLLLSIAFGGSIGLMYRQVGLVYAKVEGCVQKDVTITYVSHIEMMEMVATLNSIKTTLAVMDNNNINFTKNFNEHLVIAKELIECMYETKDRVLNLEHKIK